MCTCQSQTPNLSELTLKERVYHHLFADVKQSWALMGEGLGNMLEGGDSITIPPMDLLNTCLRRHSIKFLL